MTLDEIDEKISDLADKIEALRIQRAQVVKRGQSKCQHNWRTYKDISQVSETYCTKCNKVR